MKLEIVEINQIAYFNVNCIMLCDLVMLGEWQK